MGNIEEKNIRCFLKEVYNLYSEVTDFIFTTFNFEPDFFEEHIVSYLMGSDKKISTIGELNATNEWIYENGMCVYYDNAALISGSSCITLPVYPKRVETGVFHPKVVVIHGTLKTNKPATFLIVSSCNLTVAGYGRNQEAFSCIHVTSKLVADSLLSFLNTISDNDNNRHEKVKSYLKHTEFNNKSDVEFFWNYGKQGGSLIDKLSAIPQENLTIVSPYYDEDGPKPLLDRINNTEGITIIPAVDGGSYNIYKKHYLELKKDNVSFASLCGDGSNIRFAHAKIILKGKDAVIGSYNFTTAALDGLNAEAALIFKKEEPINIPTIKIDENLFLSDKDELVNGDSLGVGNDRIYVSITIDWQLNKLNFKVDISDKTLKYCVKIDGMKNSPEWPISNHKKSFDIDIPQDNSVINGLIRHKQFSVYKDKTICFKGLFNEVNWNGIRPEIGCETLDEALAEWYAASTSSGKVKAYELRCITDDDADTERILGIEQDFSTDIFDNYYMVSTSLEYLLQQVKNNLIKVEEKCTATRNCKRKREWTANIEKASKDLCGILFSWPGSISQILKFLDENEQKENFDAVYGWLICRYLGEAIKNIKKAEGNIPKEMEGLSILKIKSKEINSKFKEINKRIETKIQKECDNKYLEWVKNELFREKA